MDCHFELLERESRSFFDSAGFKLFRHYDARLKVLLTMETLDKFAAWFEARRGVFLGLAYTLTGDRQTAEDTVQDAFMKLRRHVLDGKSINYSYVHKTVKTMSIDKIRKRARAAKRELIARSDSEPARRPYSESLGISSTSSPYVFAAYESLPRVQRADLKAMAFTEQSYADVSRNTGRTQAAIRQSVRSAKLNLLARIAAEAIRSRDVEWLDQNRLRENIAQRVASRIKDDPRAEEFLREIFSNKKRNRAIQNATWIAAHLFPKREPRAKRMVDFLTEQLVLGDLYRGNKSYIAEALIDFDYRCHIQLVREHYILPIEDLEDRITPANVAHEESAEILRPCIYDVKKVRPIGAQILRREVLHLQKRYLSGAGSIDARRSMAFQLLRCHPDDESFVRSVIQFMREDPDQTNAYYVARYITNWGRREHPNLMDQETLDSLVRVRDRWPNNAFFQDACGKFRAHLRAKH